MSLDPVFLSRLQFGLTIGFHYLFPPLTIGLGLLMVIMEGTYLATGNRIYESLAKFWTKIFGLIFAMGVATGIVMEFQFGTNWATYSRFVGDVFGAALAAEGIFAFFLESGFLAVLVFGWDRVSSRMHFFSTVMVALGSVFSAVWIVVANSWQQTPAGFEIVRQTLENGHVVERAQLLDFWAAVFNHSTIERLTHVLIGCYIAGAFVVLSVSAFYLLRRRHEDFARRGFMIALPVALVFSVLMLVSGHSQARNVGRTQPAKLAAFEGHFNTNTDGGAPLSIVGWVDEQNETTHGIAIPGMLSFLMYDNWTAPVKGLNDPAVKPYGRPPVNVVFQAYHAMVGLGMLFIGLTALAGVLWLTGRLFRQRWLLWVFVFAVLGPIAANELGWIAAEIGRQPWIVYPQLVQDAGGAYTVENGLRTADAASIAVSGGEVLTSIIMFGLIYLLLLITWLFILDRKIRHGPESPEQLERAERERGRGWIDTASKWTQHEDSLTDTSGTPPAREGR